jgi:hypothetical protein
VKRETPQRGEQHPDADLAIKAGMMAQRETGISRPITNQNYEPG